MYLSEEKPAEIRKCIGKNQSNPVLESEVNPGENIINHIRGFHDTDRERKISRFYLTPGMIKKCLHRFRWSGFS